MTTTNSIITNLEQLRGRQLFGDIDLHFARFICRHAGPDNDNNFSYPLFLAAALVSNATVTRKHVCFDLTSVSGNLNDYFRDLTGYDRDTTSMLRAAAARAPIPDPGTWQETLRRAGVVGNPGDYAPLILDGSRLYLHRYWSYERQLGRRLCELLSQPCRPDGILLPPGKLTDISPRFAAFARENPGELNYQAVAAFAAVRNAFTVITGGPGTGKTTVVAAILALLRDQTPGLKIALCAPTGKAQARLRQAIRDEVASLNCTAAVKEALAATATHTIHRLLGAEYLTPHFRHNADHPLPVDVLVVDEASMVPLILMTKLLSALRPDTRVILLGDKDQLASVESGAVLNDLCAAAAVNGFSPAFIGDFQRCGNPATAAQLPHATHAPRNTDHVVALQRNYRFAADRGIGRVKNAVNALPDNPSEDACRAVLELIEHDSTGEITAMPLPEWTDGTLDRAVAVLLHRPLSAAASESFAAYFRVESLPEAYRIFNRMKILCSHHVGPYGVTSINRLVETALGHAPGERLYRGRPIIIRENHHALQLYNGDIGLIWPDTDTGRLRAYFPDYETEGEFRSFNPLQLPRHETVYAMTVHQAQGSGFEQIVMILPNDENSPLLTRELIYTGITRAMRHVAVWYRPAALIRALQRRTSRTGGLAQLLSR
ncbi:MAG: exodeoxyribonuclease V subunit alpha [Victivallales bacterium]|nr:exodeoxyribonuclease V subunit alpha [Victivallales bacterium]